ncbi:MAG: hypothetical protein IPH78_14015 [Bacteroidetes bacterium]|nr:hypothetical protein [Bacteroidota bacterium]
MLKSIAGFVQERIGNIEQAIEMPVSQQQDDTKSSAGDKYAKLNTK